MKSMLLSALLSGLSAMSPIALGGCLNTECVVSPTGEVECVSAVDVTPE